MNTSFPLPLQATLTQSGLPVDGVNVTFTAPGAGASGLFGASTTAVVATAGGGVASSPTFTANGTGGSYVVSAAAGAVVPAAFNLTNSTCPPPPPFIMSADTVVGAGSPNRVASVASIVGAVYAWTITNGTITSGQGTNQITYTAGVAGTTLVLDVSLTVGACPFGGAFANVTVAPTGSAVQFYSVPPCRAVDTRNANGPLGGPALAATGGVDRTFTLTGACAIPATAAAVAVNLAVVNAPFGGTLAIYRGDGALSGTTSISFNAGKARAGNGILQLALDGSGRIKVNNSSTGPVDFILDVSGFFE